MSTLKEGHRSDEITSYLSETLEPKERAAFEAHLEGCEECKRELAAQKALFAQVNQVLAVKPKRTIEEQVARFEKMVAAERATTPERKRWRTPAWAIGIGAAAATAAAAAVGILESAGPRLEQVVGAPKKPAGMVGAPRRPGSQVEAADAGGEDAGVGATGEGTKR